jgi:hypothetical protein
MKVDKLVEIDVLPEKSLPIDQSRQLINGAQQMGRITRESCS